MSKTSLEKEFHEGEWLREQINSTKMNLTQFCDKSGINLRSLHHWLPMPQIKIYGHNLARVAEGLGLTLPELKRRMLMAEDEFNRGAKP